MITGVEGYNEATFPYFPILEELTEDICDRQMTPLEAYDLFDQRRAIARLNPYIDYCSTAITTGGHARREDLTVPEVIEANTLTARRIALVLHNQLALDGRETVLPVDLGSTGWVQSEYMEFWFMTIAGLDFTGRKHLSLGFTQLRSSMDESLRRLEVDLAVMNGKDIDRSLKVEQFARFALGMAAGLKRFGDHLRPASKLVQFVDTQHSLGSFGEGVFADDLHIPKARLVPVGPVPELEAVHDTKLKDDFKIILSNGGEITIAAEESTLVVKRNDVPTLSAARQDA